MTQRQAGDQGKAEQADHVDHLRQHQPERCFADLAVFVLELTQENRVDQSEQVKEGYRPGDEDQNHRQAIFRGHDGVVENPATAETGQRRHTGHGDDADQYRDERQRHEGDQAAHLVHGTRTGAFRHAADGQEQHRFVDVVVHHEHQRHQPAEVVHQSEAEQGVPHLPD